MTEHREQIAKHIEERIAKSALDSPPVHLSRDAWALILELLRPAPTPDYKGAVNQLRALEKEAARYLTAGGDVASLALEIGASRVLLRELGSI